MPDKDIIERTLLPRWQAAYRLIKGAQQPEIVVKALISALADELRSEGGVPAFGEFVEVLTKLGGQQERARSLGEAVRHIERRFAQNGSVKAAARGVMGLSAKIEAGMALPGPLSVAEEFCWQLLDQRLLGRLERLVGRKRFPTVADLEACRSQLREALDRPLRQLAQQLARDPAASTIRAPRSARSKTSTLELIDSPVLGPSP